MLVCCLNIVNARWIKATTFTNVIPTASDGAGVGASGKGRRGVDMVAAAFTRTVTSNVHEQKRLKSRSRLQSASGKVQDKNNKIIK